jgi:gliding motility-associated-like protein
VSAAGTFQQTNPNINGCDSTHTILVQFAQQQPWDIETTQPSCRDSLGQVAFKLTAPAPVFSLNGVRFNQDTLFSDLSPGMYQVYLDDAGCLDTAFFELFQVVLPELHLPADTFIKPGQAILIQPDFPQNGNYLFAWEPAQYLSCSDCPVPLAAPAESTVYALVITDAAGCTATDQITIAIRQSTIYGPNVFSPNGDNNSDFFTLYADPLSIEMIAVLQVFDRWGNQVFERKDFQPNIAEMGWGGSFRGKAMDTGIYVWQAKVIFTSGEIFYFRGDVLLLK